METINRFIPNHYQLPRRIERLRDLSYNLWWTWNPDARRLFSEIDSILWEEVYHNPVAFLKRVERPFLNAVINDKNYLDRYDQIIKDFDCHMGNKDTWYANNYPSMPDQLIAYFSFEFGIHETLPVYAGGLGILSGDHLKEASDMGLPLTAIGFIYNEGYFSQRITEDGWQETRDYHLYLEEMPIIPLTDEKGEFCTITLELPNRDIKAKIWLVQVGRISLYLLDTNIKSNNPTDRQLTAKLYSSDPEIRIVQEMLLGIGGVRALRLMGINPTVWHMNEGHSAFMILERIRELITDGSTFKEAQEIVASGNIFTTHTPVAAGNDKFPVWLIEKYFSKYWKTMKLDRDHFVKMAQDTHSWGDSYNMPVLALRYSDHRNAVSELHGHVARKMWAPLWKKDDPEDVPITHVTNGVHMGTWLARRMSHLYASSLRMNWLSELDDPDSWSEIENISDRELWAAHKHLKHKLIAFANERARRQWSSGAIQPSQVVAAGIMLEPYSLTIGFARRFATYKRADLIFEDFDRLLKIINNPHMPVQIIFAGKAHPADEPGKLLIQKVYRAVKDNQTSGRLVFIEDYDMNIARYLVQGVDVWLNTPLRPNEASGTSGMKAAMNGVLNLSILDGWWHEAYNGRNGWAINGEHDCDDPEEQDRVDSTALYKTLENEVIPLYYSDRDKDGLPVRWIARMKESIRTLGSHFNTRRMLKEYMLHLYVPAMQSKTETIEE